MSTCLAGILAGTVVVCKWKKGSCTNLFCFKKNCNGNVYRVEDFLLGSASVTCRWNSPETTLEQIELRLTFFSRKQCLFVQFDIQVHRCRILLCSLSRGLFLQNLKFRFCDNRSTCTPPPSNEKRENNRRENFDNFTGCRHCCFYLDTVDRPDFPDGRFCWQTGGTARESVTLGSELPSVAGCAVDLVVVFIAVGAVQSLLTFGCFKKTSLNCKSNNMANLVWFPEKYLFMFLRTFFWSTLHMLCRKHWQWDSSVLGYMLKGMFGMLDGELNESWRKHFKQSVNANCVIPWKYPALQTWLCMTSTSAWQQTALMRTHPFPWRSHKHTEWYQFFIGDQFSSTLHCRKWNKSELNFRCRISITFTGSLNLESRCTLACEASVSFCNTVNSNSCTHLGVNLKGDNTDWCERLCVWRA